MAKRTESQRDGYSDTWYLGLLSLHVSVMSQERLPELPLRHMAAQTSAVQPSDFTHDTQAVSGINILAQLGGDGLQSLRERFCLVCNSNIMSYTVGTVLGTLCKTMQQDTISVESKPSELGAYQLGRSDGGLSLCND